MNDGKKRSITIEELARLGMNEGEALLRERRAQAFIPPFRIGKRLWNVVDVNGEEICSCAGESHALGIIKAVTIVDALNEYFAVDVKHEGEIEIKCINRAHEIDPGQDRCKFCGEPYIHGTKD